MNKIYLFLYTAMLVLFTNALIAQDQIGHVYQFRVPRSLQECNITGNTAGFIVKTIPDKSKFTVIGVDAANNYIIRFWNWDNPTLVTPAAGVVNPAPQNKTITTLIANASNIDFYYTYNVYYNGTSFEQRFFLVPSGELTVYCEAIEARYSPAFGAVTLPFKWRTNNGDFNKDVTLSAMGGLRRHGIPFTKNLGLSTYWNTVFGVGFTSVQLDSTNTKGTITKASDFSALTLSIGEVVEFKKLQFGIFIGWDNLSKSSLNNWDSQGKMWVGFGLGYSIFSASEDAKEDKKQ